MDMNLSLIVSLINNTQAGARKVKDTLKEFKQGFGDAVMPEFTAEQFDQNIDRLDGRINQARGKLLGAAAMLGTVFAPLKKSMDFEDAFIDFANVAEIPIDRMGEIEQKLIAQTKATGKNKTELLTILATLVGKGMGLEEAMASVEATGRASTAEKAGGEAMANSGFAVMDNLNVLPEQLQKAFDIMTASGKEGSFELADMARKFPEITAGAQSLKMTGLDAVASLSAALQIAMKSAGSADQAATNTANFMGKITAPDTVKKFAKMGVDIEKVLKDAAEDGADPLLTALKTIEKITGGDQFKMGELFQDKQVLDFLRALIPNLEEFERIRDKARSAEGIIDKDFENVSKGLRMSLKGAANAIDSLFSSSSALLPVTKELVGLFTESVYAINEWTSANPELTATIVKAVAGLLLFGAGARVVNFAYAVIARGLFGLIGLFMRFDKAGTNISIMARLFRLLSGTSRLAAGGLNLLGSSAARLGAIVANLGGNRLKSTIAGFRMLSIVGGRSSAALRFLPLIFAFIKAALAGVAAAAAGITAPIWAAIAAALALAFAIYKYWEPISNFVAGFASQMKTELAALIQDITGFGADLSAAIANWAVDKAVDTAEMLGIDPAEARQAIDGYIASVSDFGSRLISALSNGWNVAKSSVGNWLSELFSQTDYSAEAEAEFRSAGASAAKALMDAIRSIPAKIIALFAGLGSKIIGAIGSIDITGLISWPSLPSWLGGNEEEKPARGAGRRQTRGRAAIPPIYKPEEQGRSKDRVQQQIDAQIKASVVDKRPPNINVTAPITINEAASPTATAAAIRGQLGSAVAGAKGGALHDGVDD